MTNEEIRQGFIEVYNEFWCRYKDRIPEKHSSEWDRIYDQYVALRKKYPFFAEVLKNLLIEVDERARKKE